MRRRGEEPRKLEHSAWPRADLREVWVTVSEGKEGAGVGQGKASGPAASLGSPGAVRVLQAVITK